MGIEEVDDLETKVAYNLFYTTIVENRPNLEKGRDI
jgi:hypothetical protein